MELLIWWLTQQDCEAIGGEPHRFERDKDFWIEKYGEDYKRVLESMGCLDLDALDWPEYLRIEYSSRYGRAGRGRLWVAKQFNLVEIEWDDSHPNAARCEFSGGIIFLREHLPIVAQLPGLITDLGMNTVSSRE